jgi:glutamyl-tRNA reductase
MRVLALGGAGTYGRLTAEVLASSDLVSEIVIAGRDLQVAEQLARELAGASPGPPAMILASTDWLR